ncbi:UDP-N-acetylmuramoylalanine--D-glutamate ligase [Candidatus Cyrtobacter comes]|uniref:UDP-N-acetylmuramoylalanine--D-glutamate ligase n=1 Tax=Candidatus Cyrtobacter comes TaxID=675776 RepID=A0ABU5L7U1_9RICK|nr:UDP-N-acetylmuramoyl-L-alanine--D-glutamate ligase [Candidatus Cyrtobacter comes]MDZ5762196.1 UDP-N-acetylmuramoylalanine--D-glutamate ligase [Candidatus Cyrtobacter comes]
MIRLEFLKNELVFVMGLGRTGISAIKSLLISGARVIAYSDNHDEMENISRSFLECVSFQFPSEEEWGSISIMVLSPGLPKNHRVFSMCSLYKVVPMSDIELLQIANPDAKYIGVTGTNGKSTTTALIHHVLSENGIKSQMGGNIGVPALSLENTADKNEFYVIEVSSFQLEWFHKMHFNIAICLLITPDHIDFHGTFSDYVNAKAKIFDNQSNGDVAIISVDNNTNLKLYSLLDRKENDVLKVQISTEYRLNEGVSIIDSKLYRSVGSDSDMYEFISPPSLKGDHNAQNMASVFSACTAAGVKPEDVFRSFQTFKSLPHRMERFLKLDSGLEFVDDSKATNAVSTYYALESYDDIYWIAGGRSKDAGIKVLIPLFQKINHAFLIGESAQEFALILEKNEVPFTLTQTLEKAVVLIKELNPQSGVVLLSPSCASFDQWKNFEERGSAFKRLVLERWSN